MTFSLQMERGPNIDAAIQSGSATIDIIRTQGFEPTIRIASQDKKLNSLLETDGGSLKGKPDVAGGSDFTITRPAVPMRPSLQLRTNDPAAYQRAMESYAAAQKAAHDFNTVAQNLGVPATDIVQINYSAISGNVSEIGIVYEDLSPAAYAANNGSMIEAAQRQGLLPADTAFQAASHETEGVVSFRGGKALYDGASSLQSLEVRPSQNPGGHRYRLEAMPDNTTRMVFGQPAGGQDYGRRDVSLAEFEYAKSVAAATKTQIRGGPGATTMEGVTIAFNKPINGVVAELEGIKSVAPGTHAELQQAPAARAYEPRPNRAGLKEDIAGASPPPTSAAQRMGGSQRPPAGAALLQMAL